jgi:hypothetical protein
MTAEDQRLTAARREAQGEAMAFWASALTNQALGIAVARQAAEPQSYAPEQAHALMLETGLGGGSGWRRPVGRFLLLPRTRKSRQWLSEGRLP